MTKKLIKGKLIGEIPVEELSGVNILGLAKKIKKYIYNKELKLYKKIKNIRLDMDFGGYDENDENVYIYKIIGDRYETEEEQEARLLREKQAKELEKAAEEHKEQQERKEYERLKKKFGH